MVSSDHLEPGAVGQIKATVDTTGRKGHMEKNIKVISNDRTKPELILSVSMDVAR